METSPTDPHPAADATASAVPPALVEILNAPPLERKGWTTTLAPTYIALFLSVIYFDRIGIRTVAVGGLGWSIAGLAAGGVLAYLLLFLVPALWGQKTGRPLTILAASAFGDRGSVGLTVVLFGLAQVAWMVVATDYSVDYTIDGLEVLRLLDPRVSEPLVLGSLTVGSPLFLITSLVWLIAAILTGQYLVRIIGALMNVYPVFPALMLGIATVLTLQGLAPFQALPLPPHPATPGAHAGLLAFTAAIQWVVAFFAMAGLAGADWGAVNRTVRDVRVGGFVSVTFAAWTVATLGLLIVAGSLGASSANLSGPLSADTYTFRTALMNGFERRLGGAALLIFGLPALAPTCFAAFALGNRFASVRPELSRLRWSLIGGAVAWPFIVIRITTHVGAIYDLLGALFVPVAGALAADFVRSRGQWPGARRGINPAGALAWLAGFLVGISPILAALAHLESPSLQPAAVLAFVAAFVVYLAAAAVGLESSVIPLPEPPPSTDPP